MVFKFPSKRRPEVDKIIEILKLVPLDKADRSGVYYIELSPIEAAIFEEEVAKIDEERRGS